MRLIDAEALKELIADKMDMRFRWDSKLTVCEFKTIVGDIIDNAPTVYPICEDKACKYRANERPQGEWITHITYFECSDCKHCYDYNYAEDIDPITDLNFKFCPNCGADMRKGGTE